MTGGGTIGFDVTVSNSQDVSALDASVSDSLPAKADGTAAGDLDWSVSPGYTGCTISGGVGSQVLTCNLGTVAASTTLTPIHVTSSTTAADCGTVSNTASVSTSNGTGGSSNASVTVSCPYFFGKFLSPIPKSTMTYKAGSTIPVKFTLLDGNHDPVGPVAAILTATLTGQGITPVPVICTWSATGHYFQGNLKTPTLTKLGKNNPYKIAITETIGNAAPVGVPPTSSSAETIFFR